MILDITRGHIEVKIGDRIAMIPGEMFPGKNGKMGFGVYLDQIDYWEPKEAKQRITREETQAIIDDIQAEFDKQGFTLELDSI
jgi:hypothetical protein